MFAKTVTIEADLFCPMAHDLRAFSFICCPKQLCSSILLPSSLPYFLNHWAKLEKSNQGSFGRVSPSCLSPYWPACVSSLLVTVEGAPRWSLLAILNLCSSPSPICSEVLLLQVPLVGYPHLYQIKRSLRSVHCHSPLLTGWRWVGVGERRKETKQNLFFTLPHFSHCPLSLSRWGKAPLNFVVSYLLPLLSNICSPSLWPLHNSTKASPMDGTMTSTLETTCKSHSSRVQGTLWLSLLLGMLVGLISIAPRLLSFLPSVLFLILLLPYQFSKPVVLKS